MMTKAQDLLAVVFILFICWSYGSCKQKGNGRRTPQAPVWRADSPPARKDSIIAKTEGSQIRLNCAAGGRPKPTVLWYKDGELFDFRQRKKTRTHRFQLILNDVKSEDSGNYKCLVQNNHGTLNFTFMVDVVRASEHLEVNAPQNVTVRQGEDAQFICQARNHPDATAQWVKQTDPALGHGGTAGANGDMVESAVNDPGVLLIQNVQPEDAGQYTCWIGTYFTIVDYHAWLTVIPLTTLPPTTTTTTPTTTTMPTTTTTTSTTTTTTPTTTTTVPTTPMPTTSTEMTTFYFPDTTFDFSDFDMDPERDREGEKKKKRKKKKDRKRKNKKRKDRKRNKKKHDKNNRNKNTHKENINDNTNDNDGVYNPYDREDFERKFNLPDDINYPGMEDIDQGGIDFNNELPPGLEPTPPPPSHNDGSHNDGSHEFGHRDNQDDTDDKGMVFKPIDNSYIETSDTNAETEPKNSEEAEVSVWTIYIIVGSVAGGILLVGLVAIVVAVCCNRIEEGGYKSTSV